MATRSRLPAHPACRRARLPIGRGRRGGAGLRAQPASRRAASRFGRQIAPEKAAVRAALIGRGAGPGAGCGWTRGTPGAGLPLAAPSFELPGGGGGRWRETRRRPPPPPTVKVRLLQACVVDLSEQDAVLVQTVEELESQMPELLKVAAAEAGQQPPSLAPRRPMPAERRSGSTATQAVLEQEGLRSLAALRELRGEAGRRQEELEAEVPHCEEIVQELQEDLAVSPASQGAAEGSSCRQEEEEEEEAAAAPQQQQKERLLHHKRKMLQSEVHRLKELLRAEPLEACTLAEELHGQGRALHTVQKATRQLEAESRRETTEQALRTEEELAALLEELSTCQTQVGVRSQTIAELQGGLKAAEQEQRQVKEQFTREEAELSSLWRRLRHQQEELSSLQASCAEQEARMVEQTRLIRQLQQEKETSLGQERSKGAGLEEELQGEPGGSQEARQQLHLKLQSLQQELDACKGRNQENLSKLQARQCTVEEQSLDLDLLLQRCQLLKEQLFYYEEVIQKQDLELSRQQAQQRCTQEQLAQAESSLGLYRQKFLASLDRAGQLEEQLQHLETEVASQLLGQEEALAVLHEDLASYKATHSCPNSTYESQRADTEALRQKLLQAEGESAEHQQRAKEYQGLAEALKLELWRAAEQKSSTLQDVARLERTVQSLRQEAAAERERQQLAGAEGRRQLQQLEAELRQSRKESAQRQQAIQKRDELLHKSRAEMVHARGALQEKGKEAEQQRAEALRLEAGLQEAQRELERSRAECASLHTEAQGLRQSLHESQQQAARELARQEEQLLLAQSSLHGAQEQLSQRLAELTHHAQAGRRLETELQVLQERLAGAGAELEQKRDQLEQLAEELSQARQQQQVAKEEAQHQRQVAAQLERDLEESRVGLRGLQKQLQSQESTLEVLRADLSQREEALQGELQAAQQQESRLAQERHDLQRQLQRAQQRLQQEERTGRSLQASACQREAESRALREQLQQQAAQLEQAQLQLQQQTAEVLRQEATLAQLHTELHSLQERERQRSRSLAAAQGLAQELQLQAAACQASQRQAAEQLEERAQEASCLQAELQQGQHKAAHLQEELAASHAQAAQLKSQLSALQRAQEQQACASEERLDGLSGQVRHWQGEQRAAKLALAAKDEELVVVKVELASLEEKYHRAREENEELQSEVNLLRQKFVVSSREVESLQTSLEAARSDSHRLNHESELVVANVSQWVKEQKLVNEKLGHKIRSQVKQLAQLTGERDHLQGLVEKLQREKRCLQSEVGERRLECERLKARHSSEWDPRAVRQQPWPLLQGEDPPCATERRGKALAAKWNLS
ncbi:polyamine-modulated factor 1-binding protein 1 isoform X7 [Hemicordylus capensis]|uniref:polyamine-modulated factor 1-binding protein 1 isoform X7 n=1 Tax=Hemicordylus capensis TaxID=884348 RepID=UPI002303920A|nr:polyamine-modulated factor 1-binding protein 1 isoform X7 [Hemicordylus capensis]